MPCLKKLYIKAVRYIRPLLKLLSKVNIEIQKVYKKIGLLYIKIRLLSIYIYSDPCTCDQEREKIQSKWKTDLEYCCRPLCIKRFYDHRHRYTHKFFTFFIIFFYCEAKIYHSFTLSHKKKSSGI